MPSQNQIVKSQKVDFFKSKFSEVEAALVADCSAVPVEDITAFRAEVRAQQAEFHVLKNTLAKRAIQGTPMASLSDAFVGQTAVAITSADPIALAKILKKFSDGQKTFKMKAGVLNGNYLDENEVIALANVPSREVLLSRLVGSLSSPYSGLVFGLSGILRKLVYALEAVRRKKEEEGN